MEKRAKINELYKPLYTSKKRYFLLTGGRGSLKSSTVHDFIARLTYERGHGVLFTRFTLTSAEDSIIPEFKETLDRLGITSDFTIRKNEIVNRRTQSFIKFRGIKTSSGMQTAKLKSIQGITTWVVEEGEDFDDEKTFDDIDDSIRAAHTQNRVIWVQNPSTREHFIYKRMIEPNSRQINVEGFNVTVSNMPEVEHIHTTYKIAERLGYLNQGWLAKANKFYSQVRDKVERERVAWLGKPFHEWQARERAIWHTSHYYYNYIGGWLEKREGVIFENWIEGEFDESLPYCYGLDYGYSPDPLAFGKVALDHKLKRIYLKEYIYETLLKDVVGALDRLGIYKNDLIVADTSEPRTTENIRSAGYNIEGVHKTQSVGNDSGIAQDIREINKWLLVVDPNSHNAKKELNHYVWNDKLSSIPIDDYNHIMDLLRYGYGRLTKKKKRKAKRRR